MKNKIAKILGVVLTLATLTSMFVFASPVSAGTQAWSSINLPSVTNNVLGTADVLGNIAQSKDGSVIYMGAGTAFDQGLFKSTDFGRTWAAVQAFPNNPAYTGQIFDIAFGADASTVYVTDDLNIFKTSNGGTTWTTIAGLFNSTLVFPNPASYITSIAVGYLGGAPYIFATTSTFGNTGAGNGDAYVCQEAVYGSPWSALNVGADRPENTSTSYDTLRVVLMPDFSTTQGVMILWSDYDGGLTRVSVKLGGGQWDAAVNDVRLAYSVGVVLTDVSDTLLSANIFLPSDFSSNPATGLMQAYVGIDPIAATSPAGDVYLAYFGPAASGAVETPAFDLNVGGSDSATNVSCLSGVGTAAGAYVMISGSKFTTTEVGVVYTTKNGGQTWTAATKNPTGGASPFLGRFLSVCVVKNDFATSGQALVATHGTDNGVSFTADFGVSFNTISFIDTTITALVNISLATDNTIYATTHDGADNYSVWRNTTAGWERILSYSLLAGAPDFDFISTVPDNSALFVADVGTGGVFRSLDKGQTWRQQLSLNPAGAFTAWLVVSANTQLIAQGGNIYQTTTNGVVWFTRVVSATITSLTDVKVASNGDYLVAGTDGGSIWLGRSTDGGLTWSAFDTNKTGTAGYVTAATDYATSNNVFFTGNAGSIWRGAFASTTTWKQVDGTPTGALASGITTDTVANGNAILAAAGGPGNSSEGTGMVYVTDNTAATGVDRVRGSALYAELLAKSTISFSGLWMGSNSVGSVALYTIGSDAKIYTYTDTMNKAGTGVAISAVTAHSAIISWAAMANATSYFVAVSPIAPITSAYALASAFDLTEEGYIVTANTSISTNQLNTIFALDSVTTYYVSVWAVAPVSSFMFGGTASFTTNPDVPTFPTGLVPFPGQQNVQTLPTFQWDPVYGATSYELWLDTKSDFSSAQKFTGILTNAFAAPTALANNAIYYWQVRAVTSTGVSAWNGTWSFTTVLAPQPVVTVPPAPTPTIIITAPPQVTVTQAAPVPTPTFILPQPTITIAQPEAQTPTYIWIIVAVGAVLTLAVIILIVRTRRVV